MPARLKIKIWITSVRYESQQPNKQWRAGFWYRCHQGSGIGTLLWHPSAVTTQWSTTRDQAIAAERKDLRRHFEVLTGDSYPPDVRALATGVLQAMDSGQRGRNPEIPKSPKQPGTALVPITPAEKAELAFYDRTLPLTTQEKRLRNQLEKEIARDMPGVFRIGEALRRIRDERLYRNTHATFEVYTRERWGISRSDADRQIAAARVNEIVTPIGVKMGLRLTNESQCRPLAKLEAEDIAEVLKLAAKKAGKSSGDGSPQWTARIIAEAAREYTTPSDEVQRRKERREDRQEATSMFRSGGTILGDPSQFRSALLGEKPALSDRGRIPLNEAPEDGNGVQTDWKAAFAKMRDELVWLSDDHRKDLEFQRDLVMMLIELGSELANRYHIVPMTAPPEPATSKPR
jgi:hypothetical protein